MYIAGQINARTENYRNKKEKTHENDCNQKGSGRHRPLFPGLHSQRFPVYLRSGPLNPETGEIVGTTIAEQAEQSCKNIGAILEAAGTDFSKVIKTTCFLADMKDFAAFNAVYEKYFVSKPARSCVAVRELPKQVLCEVEAIALAE